MFSVATLYPVSRLVKSMVEEKETRMREVLKIMGLRDWVHQLSWFLTAFVLFFWIALSTTIFTTSFLFRFSNKVLIFLYFFLFSMSEISLSFLVAVFFSNSKLAAIVGPVALFVTLLPKFIFLSTNANEDQNSKFLVSLLSPTAFSFGADIIANYESANLGIQYSNMYDGMYSFVDSLVFMTIDTLLYGALAWYFGQVMPSEFGTPKNLCFPFQRSYWCNSGNANATLIQQNLDPSDVTPEMADRECRGEGGHVEPLTPEQHDLVRVRLSGLKKRYSDGKVAVKGVSMAMLEGQITCLLGHNGAGKSTTVSMLTGLTTPTAGECLIWGHALSSGLQSIRKITGIW